MGVLGGLKKSVVSPTRPPVFFSGIVLKHSVQQDQDKKHQTFKICRKQNLAYESD